MTYTRLFGRVHPHSEKPIEQLTVRVRAVVPDGAEVRVTDLQVQPGHLVTGWTLHPTDLGVQAVTGWSWRNAVLSGDRRLVLAADVASASPTRWDVRGEGDACQLGTFFAGDIESSARVDGWNHTATQGAGLPPHLTERSDVDINATLSGRAVVCCWFRDIETPGDDLIIPPAEPADTGSPVTGNHSSWGQLLAIHGDWADVRSTHTDWS